jgi:hypothetical protein
VTHWLRPSESAVQQPAEWHGCPSSGGSNISGNPDLSKFTCSASVHVAVVNVAQKQAALPDTRVEVDSPTFTFDFDPPTRQLEVK